VGQTGLLKPAQTLSQTKTGSSLTHVVILWLFQVVKTRHFESAMSMAGFDEHPDDRMIRVKPKIAGFIARLLPGKKKLPETVLAAVGLRSFGRHDDDPRVFRQRHGGIDGTHQAILHDAHHGQGPSMLRKASLDRRRDGVGW
jgi:hypothetical protein